MESPMQFLRCRVLYLDLTWSKQMDTPSAAHFALFYTHPSKHLGVLIHLLSNNRHQTPPVPPESIQDPAWTGKLPKTDLRSPWIFDKFFFMEPTTVVWGYHLYFPMKKHVRTSPGFWLFTEMIKEDYKGSDVLWSLQRLSHLFEDISNSETVKYSQLFLHIK